jgi:hypothetical protein
MVAGKHHNKAFGGGVIFQGNILAVYPHQGKIIHSIAHDVCVWTVRLDEE